MDVDTSFLIQAVLSIVAISDGWEMTLEIGRLIAQVIPCDEVWLSDLGMAATTLSVWRCRETSLPGSADREPHELRLTTGREGESRQGWTVVRHRTRFSEADVASAARLLPVIVCLDRLALERRPVAQPADCQVTLSVRERTALAMVAQGLTAAAIGRRMGIAPSTVRKHLEHAYSKLGHHDRLTAVTYARDLGLLDETTRARATVLAGVAAER